MKSGYTKLSRITFIRGLGITLGTVVFVFLLRTLTRGYLTDTIVRWIAQGFSMNETQVDMVYFKVVTANMQFVLGIIIILFMLLLLHILLHFYKRYFDKILLGIDKLMKDGGCTSLSSELETVGRKLNYAEQILKARADEAKKIGQQKNDLVVYLAHDIKTPLTSAIGYLSLLDKNPDMADDKKAEYVHTAQEKTNRLRVPANELFEITRGCLESTALHGTEISFYYMLIQTPGKLYPQLSTCRKHIESNVGENISVYGDSEKLARVFSSILKNAISYNENSSAMSVSAKEFPEKTVTRFENKGSIPDDKLSLVFDRFYRLSSAKQSDTGGSGLGLAIAKDIVILHGGRIQAESNNGYTALTIEILSAVCKDPGIAN